MMKHNISMNTLIIKTGLNGFDFICHPRKEKELCIYIQKIREYYQLKSIYSFTLKLSHYLIHAMLCNFQLNQFDSSTHSQSLYLLFVGRAVFYC